MNYELRIKNKMGTKSGHKCAHNLSFIIRNSQARGFTFIEILVVIAVMSIIGSVVAYGFYSFFRASALNAAADVVHATLEEAHANTLTAQGDSRYGVHFESDRAVFFRGAVYSAGDPENDVQMMPRGVSVSAIFLNGGGAEVIFDRLTGNTGQYGSVTISHPSPDVNDIIINISAAGIIDVN